MATNNIQGGAKTGLGAALVVDGQQFPAAWLPSAINFTRNTLDVSHAQTEDFRASIVEELAEELTVTGQFYFDPKLKALVDLMKSTGANQDREIYIIVPKTSDAQGVTTEPMFLYLSVGKLGIGTIALDIEDTMKADFTVAGGIQSPIIEHQQTVAGNAPVSTSIVETNLSGTLKDDVVATITGVGVTHGPTIFFELGGTDVADFYLEGKFIKAVADGGGGTGVKSLTVSAAGYRAWSEGATGEHLTGEAIGFTLT